MPTSQDLAISVDNNDNNKDNDSDRWTDQSLYPLCMGAGRVITMVTHVQVQN